MKSTPILNILALLFFKLEMHLLKYVLKRVSKSGLNDT